MLQQILALVIILFFLSRLFKQKKKKQIAGNEFIFWLSFWGLGALAVILLKPLDSLVKSLGFSSSAINYLLYLAILTLFYLIFKLRLKISKLDKDLTDLVSRLSINKSSL